MKITVKVYGHLRRYLPGNAEKVVLEMENGSTIDDFLLSRKIPDEDVWVVTRNGERAGGKAVLADGDEVCIFTPVGGG